MKRKAMTAILVITLLLAALPQAHEARPIAAAQNQVTWTAQFYNNLYLSGTPARETTYNALGLNWGLAAPFPEVQPDTFSARFASDPYFQAGTYRFYMLADDAVQLWIDFPPSKQPQFSSFDSPRPGQLLTFDFTLTEGYHHIQIDYREFIGNAYVFVAWADLATNPSPPNFLGQPTTPPSGGIVVGLAPWTAQYFNNAALQGTPVIVQTEPTPTHNWGYDAPVAGVPADFFSVRWMSVQTLNAGTYQIGVRADDGVRVFVDNQLVINEFHGATDQTYTASVTLSAGQHIFTIEYYEAALLALIEFNLTLPGGPVTLPITGGPSATVLAYRLNVRDQPSIRGEVITQIELGEVYPILGRNATGTWLLINVNGIQGWVSAAYVSISNEQPVPIVGGTTPTSPTPIPTTYTLRSRANLNIRSGPGLGFQVIGRLPFGQQAQVIGRNADTTWWQIRYNNLTGWVIDFFVTLQAGADINRIPITG